MTLNELQEKLIDEVEGISKDMCLTDSRGQPARLKGYPQSIPVISLFRDCTLSWISLSTLFCE